MKIASRSKIHPKIIFQHISNDATVLILGDNNFDIIEVLKHKQCNIKEVTVECSEDIISELKKYNNKAFDYVILNLELSRVTKNDNIISLAVDKAHYTILRVRNKSILQGQRMFSKKRKILNICRKNKFNVFKTFYCKKNYFTRNPFYVLSAYYVVYFVTNKRKSFLFQEEFVNDVLTKLSQKRKKSLTFARVKK